MKLTSKEPDKGRLRLKEALQLKLTKMCCINANVCNSPHRNKVARVPNSRHGDGSDQKAQNGLSLPTTPKELCEEQCSLNVRRLNKL